MNCGNFNMAENFRYPLCSTTRNPAIAITLVYTKDSV
jgi:hypothetical protein